MLLSATSVLALSSITYAAIGPSADIHVVNKVIQPDGFKRSAVLAGDSVNSAIFPGPVITGVKGDRFLLNVIDSLTDSSMLKSTSIHWHGLFQHGSSWADGTAFVTQCPIAPQHSFLYDFSVPDQAGTFWYHSHVSTQYCDGLRGAIVIYDPEDPYRSLYDVDDESTVITLADWYHTPAPSAGPAPVANSTLINGLGRYANGPSSPLAVIAVTSGKRYRFRLVSLSCDPDFIFSIDGHALTIIEVDGVHVEPLVVDSIDIFAGQRYSFILNANHTADNYWIRALPAGTTAFSGGLNSAILRYVGVQTTDPTTASNLTNPMLETNLHPLQNPSAPGQAIQGGADVMLNLNIGYNASSVSYSINGAEFVPPTVPVLLQILSGARSAHELLPAGAVYSLPLNKVIEISIPGGAQDSPHPFHLHGHTFDVVRSAGSSDYNYENPVRRDVVSTGVAGDNVTIRFTTDNPGPWFLHCHIDWHLDLGLAIVLAEAPSNIISQSHPAAWDSLCPTYKALSASNH